MRNDADSSYQALQAQFRHRLAHGLQTLLSYTWAHSIDDASSDAYFVNVPPGDSPCLRSVVRPTTTSGRRSPAQFPITFRRRAAESGSRSLETGRRIRSFTLEPRPR